jgi:hypothetical protein
MVAAHRGGASTFGHYKLLPEQGDLQVLGPIRAATRCEQVEQEREELREERPEHVASPSVCLSDQHTSHAKEERWSEGSATPW